MMQLSASEKKKRKKRKKFASFKMRKEEKEEKGCESEKIATLESASNFIIKPKTFFCHHMHYTNTSV